MESFSWIEESERMCSIETNLLREKLSSIPMMFIYINKHNVIDSIDTEILLLPDISHIPKEKLIKLIKSKQKNTPVSKYILKEFLLYHIPLEPEHISSFIHSSESTSFLKIFPIIEDVPLPPSLFIFHSINGLYFLYYESDSHSKSIKSILKTADKSINTKKVKIHSKRTTRKNTILIE